MTLIENSRRGAGTPLAKRIAEDEGMPIKSLLKGLARGRIVIPKNKIRGVKKPCGIGEGLRTKINANIGTSMDSDDPAYELKKLDAAVRAGADTVMDLSTGPSIRKVRKEILEKSPVPVGTVPIYEAAADAIKKYGRASRMREADIFNTLENQAKDGVDFFTIHSGITTKSIKVLKSSKRVINMVSRGGAILAEWIIANKKENPLFARFDEVIDIARQYDITLSLGDGLRPGSIIDATDKPQIEELMILGNLRKRALNLGVQVIIEGPGHVPMDQIQANVGLEKSICGGAPFYVLGPIVTDASPGYDHITSAIGGAMAAYYGADFLCYVTPSEHLRLPTLEDVKEGVVSAKIAAHAADIAKHVKGARDLDMDMSRARADRDWEKQFALAIEKDKPRAIRAESKPKKNDVCTMCSEYCSLKVASDELFLKGSI